MHLGAETGDHPDFVLRGIEAETAEFGGIGRVELTFDRELGTRDRRRGDGGREDDEEEQEREQSQHQEPPANPARFRC